MQQSAFSENVVPRKDSCLIRKHGSHEIKHTCPPSSYGKPIINDKNGTWTLNTS